MKNLILAIATLFFMPSLAGAQELLNIYCEDCRDLSQYPEDARNFSYNQVFGTQSWLTMGQADRFQVTDRFGTTVTIDMNIDYQINFFTRTLNSFTRHLFDIGDFGKLAVEGLIIQIRVIYRNLDIVSYRFTRLDVTGDLPVGQDNARPSPAGGSHDGGEDDGDDFDEWSDYEYEESYEDDEEFQCEECTLQSIYPDGELGDPVDMPTWDEWENIREL